MEKVIYVLSRGADLTPEDFSTTLRGEVCSALASAGAHGIQVNVADAAVAQSASRPPPSGDQVDALVALWVDSARDETRMPFEKPLRRLTDRLSGWLVTESVPISPPPSDAGERTEGLANVAFISRPPHMTYADWLDRWQNHHTKVAIETQSTFGYIQNVVQRTLTEETFAVDAIVEELFPIQACTDPHVWFDTGGDAAELERRSTQMAASVASFLERAAVGVIPTSRFVLSTPFG